MSERPVGRDSGERLFLNTISGWLANVTTLIVGFFLTRYLLDQLGERLYGLYALGASVAAWSAFLGVPIGTYASRYATEHLERGETEALRRTMATSLGLSLLTTLILPLPVIFFAAQVHKVFGVPPDLVEPARVAILIIGLGAVASVVIRVWESTVFMARRFYLKNFADVASRLVGAALLVLWFHWLGPSFGVWLVITVGLPLALTLGFVVPAARRGLPVRLLSVALERSEVGRAVPFVLMMLGTSLGSLLFDNTDAFVISAMRELGVAQLAAYDVGTRWQRVVRPFVETFTLALSPGLVALVARGDRARLQDDVAAHTKQILLLGMIPAAGLASVARPFITHWVGEEFVSRSVPVMWIALANAALWGAGPYGARVMVAVARLRFITIGGVIAGLGNLLLSVFFVRALGLGLVGVALGTLVSTVLWCDIAIGLVVCRTTGLSPLTYVREAWLRPMLALPVMLLFSFGVGSIWFPGSLLETVLQLCVSEIGLAGVAYAIGLNPSERAAVRLRVGHGLTQLRGMWPRT